MIIDLGLFPIGSQQTLAWHINNRGQVVGSNVDFALLFEDGQILNLNDRIHPADPLEPHVVLTEARAINDRGEIVAVGFDSRVGATRSYLLVPVRH